MDMLEHYLILLMEECGETTQRASKQLRFGRDEVQPGQPEANHKRLRFEILDVLACVDFLVGSGQIESISSDDVLRHQAAKQEKIDRMLALSRAQGCLATESTCAHLKGHRYTSYDDPPFNGVRPVRCQECGKIVPTSDTDSQQLVKGEAMGDCNRIRIGIEPEDRPDCAIVTPAEMRQAIDKAKYESALVGNCMRTADYAGFSAEDRYTVLAYNALVALETYYKRCLMIRFPITKFPGKQL